MSFEQKYIKYKSKYLALKSQLNIYNQSIQNGGSIYNEYLEDFNSSSQTSNLKSEYDNYLNGGKTESEKSASEKSASEKSASEKSASEKSASEKLASEKSASEKSASEKYIKKESDDSEDADFSDDDSEDDDIKDDDSEDYDIKDDDSEEGNIKNELDDETELSGGYKYSKVKSNKKYFFDDSDVNLDSTTTDSELSSLDTDSTDESDI